MRRRTMRNFLLTSLVLIGTLTYAAPLQAWPGTVVRVQDGDSLLVTKTDADTATIIVRLYGIDAPELHQQGGEAARDALQALLPRGQVVDVTGMDTDPYDRVVGLVTAGDTTVNVSLLEQGHAWFNKKFCRANFCSDWKKIEKRARKQHIGLWAAPRPEPPWVWRKKNPRKAD